MWDLNQCGKAKDTLWAKDLRVVEYQLGAPASDLIRFFAWGEGSLSVSVHIVKLGDPHVRWVVPVSL